MPEPQTETPTFEQRLLEGRDVAGMEVVVHFGEPTILTVEIPGVSQRFFNVVGNTITEFNA